MARARTIAHGQPRRPLPDNALGLPLDGFGDRIGGATSLLLVARKTHTAVAAARVEDLAGLLASHVADHGPAAGADRYLDRPIDERRDRVAAAVTVSLLSITDPTLLAARDAYRQPNPTARRLSELEIGAVRIGTWISPVRAAAVALAEAGAVVGQCLDLCPNTLTTVSGAYGATLPANRGVVARHVRLPEWSTPLITKAADAARSEGHRLCLTKPPGERTRERRNIHANLVRALAVAGVDATAASIRLTPAFAAYDRSGIQAATAVLGTTSTASARRLLGL